MMDIRILTIFGWVTLSVQVVGLIATALYMMFLGGLMFYSIQTFESAPVAPPKAPEERLIPVPLPEKKGAAPSPGLV